MKTRSIPLDRTGWSRAPGAALFCMAILAGLAAGRDDDGATIDTLRADLDSLTVICQEAGNLSADSLRTLVVFCDSLVIAIEESDHPRRKLFRFRLKKSRDYFTYLLDLGAIADSTRTESGDR